MNVAPEPGQKNEGYVFVELREFSENFDRNSKEKDPRFILLKGITLAKFLLITPKCGIENSNKLEQISNPIYLIIFRSGSEI
jgi:hypothetical protein